jgi:hypothetical protein
MSDDNDNLPAAAPMPRMTPEQIEAAREKIAGYLAEAEAQGIALRPITGQVMRLAKKIDLDLERLGADIDAIPDDDYFDQVIQAAWLLTEDPAAVVAACHEGEEIACLEAELWAMGNLATIEREGAVLRCFVARWLEYRVEMQILKQRSEPEAP